MKCSNCNQENNADALFCTSCGAGLNGNGNPTPTSTMNNSNTNKPKKNKWLIIGLIAAFVVGIILIGGGNDNSDDTVYNSGYSTNDKETFGNFLVAAGFTRKSSTIYTYYNDGYLYTFDFNEDVFSQESDTMYNAYYYKKDIFGTAMVSDSLEIIATYNFSTYSYNCEATPASYQSYACSYMQSTITELAITIKSTFYTFINQAGVSIYNL